MCYFEDMISFRVKAYSLIELVVVLTILSIISMMTLPNYQQWIKRFRYWEILQEVHPVKLQVEWCYWQHGSLEECSIKESEYDAVSAILSVEVNDGVIHIIPKSKNGLSVEDDLLMKPVIKKGRLVWHYSGVAVRKSYVKSS